MAIALHSEVDAMDARAYALMNAVGLKRTEPKMSTGIIVRPLSAKNIYAINGDLNLECRKNSGNAHETPSDTLIFKDKYDRVKISGEIKYTPSAREAQLILFRELAMNSLPLSILVQRYEKKRDGPGDLCIVSKVFDQTKNTYVTDTNPRKIYFIRGNAVVYLKTTDTESKIDEASFILDQKLQN